MAQHSSGVAEFLDGLAKLRDEEIPDSDCPVCYVKYGSPFDQIVKHAVRLPPCGHIVGSKCIEIWLLEEAKNTCPFCRRELFPYYTEDEDDAQDTDEESTEVDEDNETIENAVGDGEEVYCEYGVDFDEYHQLVQRLESSSRAHEAALETYALRTRQLYHRLYRAGADIPRLSRQADNILLGNEQEALFSKNSTEEALSISDLCIGLEPFILTSLLLSCGKFCKRWAMSGGLEWCAMMAIRGRSRPAVGRLETYDSLRLMMLKLSKGISRIWTSECGCVGFWPCFSDHLKDQ